uniref:Peptide O-xylosyltransferase n=1 Tax=Desulfacinum infernum TaxID=35837 RepID=A0A831ZZY7_9BACT
MKIAYLIIAYNNARHFPRLIRALNTPRCGFFVHIDKKYDITPYTAVRGQNIVFSRNRVPVYWGDFSTVEAILIVLREALQSAEGFERFVLLSGSDYPVRSAESIERFFESHRETEYMNLVPMPSKALGKPLTRLSYYRPGPLTPPWLLFTAKALMKLHLWPHRNYRKVLGNMKPYGGSMFWALTRNAAQYLLDFVDRRPDFLRFYRNTYCPDEMMLQTILGNSPFAPNIRRNLTYADWSARGRSPEWINRKHLDLFKTTVRFPPDDPYGPGDMLFARKFSEDADDLVEELNRIIAEREAGG